MIPTLLILQQQPADPIWFVRLVAFFQANALGVLMLLLSVATGALAVQWVLWAFGLGRFKGREATPSHSLRFLFSDALVKIIDDFRHLLALIIVGIFAGAVVWALTVAGQNAEDITQALQAVVSTLGGLVGSIIGYYFGEARGRTVWPDGSRPGVPVGEQAAPPPTGAPEASTDIRRAQSPPTVAAPTETSTEPDETP